MTDQITAGNVKGRVRVWREENGIWLPVTPWRSNLVLYEWATIVGKLLTQGLTNYHISGMFLEYKNVASPGDPVSAPAFGRAGGITYYNDLSTSPDTDYIRSGMTASTVTSSDAVLFPSGNVLTFFARTSGVIGTHGKPFAAANNSKLFGIALVAFVDQDDATQDIVFSRAYLDTDDQQLKLDSSQLGMEWEITLL
jgi:hypothetical protein